MMMMAVPISLTEANVFIAQHHRHHPPIKFHKFSVGVAHDGKLVGVCVVNRPVSIAMDNGQTLEICRLCTDGTKNACSFLLSKAATAAKALGYRKIQTYTLAEESVESYGGSLRAAGWWFSHCSPGGTWNNNSRSRVDKHPIGEKFCWFKELPQ